MNPFEPQLSLLDESPTGSESLPLVYVACPLTNLTEDDRWAVDGLCLAICRGIDRVTLDAAPDQSWPVRRHLALDHTAPWRRPTLTHDQVYALNAQRIREAAAVIMLAYKAGSFGMGQELEAASRGGAPILIAAPVGHSVSGQIRGRPADIAYMEFASAHELETRVSDFLKRRRHSICDRVRINRMRDQRFSGVLSVVVRTASSMNLDTVAAEAGLDKRRLVEILSSPGPFAAASLEEVDALCGVLNVEFFEPPAASHATQELTTTEQNALATAAAEYEWSHGEVLRLASRARLELARGGIRRLPLGTPSAWVSFRRRINGR